MASAVYLDTAGAALYSRAQLAAHMRDLEENLFGNPHSHNPSSQLSTDRIAAVRQRVLRHFGVTESEYEVVFTRGATDAIKLLCEAFAFVSSEPLPAVDGVYPDLRAPPPADGRTSVYAYLEDNHTSVVACRDPLLDRGVHVFCASEESLTQCAECPVHRAAPLGPEDAGRAPYLFAYPAHVL